MKGLSNLIPACCSPAADSPRLKMDSSALEQSSHLCRDKEGAHW